MSAGAFEDDGDAVIEMDILPPRWADVSDEVTELLASIASKSQKLEKLHQKHVLPGFDDEEVKKKEEAVIERLTQDITRGFHDCQRAIQKVEQMVKESKQQGGISKGEETMARNIQISLAGRVQEASAGFRKKQSAYLKSKIPQHLTNSALMYPELRGLGGMSSPWTARLHLFTATIRTRRSWNLMQTNLTPSRHFFKLSKNNSRPTTVPSCSASARLMR